MPGLRKALQGQKPPGASQMVNTSLSDLQESAQTIFYHEMVIRRKQVEQAHTFLASSSSSGVIPCSSWAPDLSACSVDNARVLTQCPWPGKLRTSLPSCGSGQRRFGDHIICSRILMKTAPEE